MRSPLWKRRRPARARRRRPPSTLASGFAALLVAACAALRAPEAPPLPVAAEDRPYLISPLAGFPAAVPLPLQREVEAAHRQLLEEGDASAAGEHAARWLAADPAFHPATVLLAAVDAAGGRWGEARDRLAPIAAAMPGYLAARLLLGRTLEHLEELPGAVAAYHAVADQSALAAASVTRLRPRAAAILALRIEDALARSRLEAAREALAALEAWAPQSEEALEAALAVGEAAGEPERALLAARRLAAARPADLELRARLAELELAAGDAGTGLRLLEELAAARPDDAALAERLVAARFQWRLQLLPPAVRELRGQAVLSRADFAALVYWLFPTVRHGRPERATIATDILDHPARREIAHVVNLELLDVDADLHLFHPGRAISRQEALTAVLRLLANQQPPAACAQPAAVPPGAPSPAVCEAAHRCLLIASPADCLPSAFLSGAEAIAMAHRGLAQLGTGDDAAP